MSSRLGRLARAFAFATSALAAVSVASAGELRLAEHQAIEAAVISNPGLEGARIDAESAGFEVVGADGQYPLTLGLTAGYTHSATPTAFGSTVTTLRSDAVDLGASLSKRFALGTQLSLSTTGTYDLGDSAASTQAFGGAATTAAPIYGLGLRFSVVQPLLRGAGTEVGDALLDQAVARRSAAEMARERTASDLVRSVITAYWELWYATESVAIQQRSLVLAKQQRDEAKAKIDTGTLAPVDLLSFETRVATQEEAVASATIERQARSSALLAALGRAGTGDIVLPTSEPQLPPPAEAGAMDRAEKASPEIAEARQGVVVAEVQARTASDATRSRLDLDAYLEARGIGNDDVAAPFAQVGELGAVSAHVGLTFEAPLDDRAHSSSAARAALAVRSAKARLESSRQSVLSSVATEVERDVSARQRLTLAQTSAGVAQKQLEAEKARFDTGTSTPLAVRQAEEDLRNAELRVARARVDLVEARATLDHLTGRLLERTGVRLESETRAQTGLWMGGPRGAF